MSASESNAAGETTGERLAGPAPGPLAFLSGLFPIAPNAACQGPDSVTSEDGYDLAIVEFDDQGVFHDRGQQDALLAKLKERAGKDTIVLAFVHGWKHNAADDDGNLIAFKAVLKQAAADEKAAGARVLGVYIGWRGASLKGGLLSNITFWDRKQAAFRVGLGSVRELFGRLRQFRHSQAERGSASSLILVGHGFGGLVVYQAAAQSLIEAATTPSGEIVPSFADLILLVNPAFEAVRYLPVHSLVEQHGPGSYAPDQQPFFVAITSETDWATGLAFPLGAAMSLLQEETANVKERQGLTHTVGHVPWMQTHLVSAGAKVERTQFAEGNPFWIAKATRDVINGHDDIANPVLLDFVRELLSGHIGLAVSRKKAAKAAATAAAKVLAPIAVAKSVVAVEESPVPVVVAAAKLPAPVEAAPKAAAPKPAAPKFAAPKPAAKPEAAAKPAAAKPAAKPEAAAKPAAAKPAAKPKAEPAAAAVKKPAVKKATPVTK